MEMEVSVKKMEGAPPIIEVKGEVDVYTSPKVKETIIKLINEGVYNLIISLEEVHYIDSTGLGILVSGLKRVKENNGDLYLVCTNPNVQRVFDITGLVKIFNMYRSVEEVLESFLGR